MCNLKKTVCFILRKLFKTVRQINEQTNKQTNKQNRTNFEFEKDKQFIEKWVDFYEFRGFSNFERHYQEKTMPHDARVMILARGVNT